MCMTGAIVGYCAVLVRVWLCKAARASMHMAARILECCAGAQRCRDILDMVLFLAALVCLYVTG